MDPINSNKEENNPNIDFKYLKVKQENYNIEESKNMFINFLILGYEYSYLKETSTTFADKPNNNQINNINVKKNDSLTNKQFHLRELPMILNIISSNFYGPVINGNQIIENIFPVPPAIFILNKNEEIPSEKMSTFVIFSLVQDNIINYGYGHIFYEKIIYDNELKVYAPKAFVII